MPNNLLDDNQINKEELPAINPFSPPSSAKWGTKVKKVLGIGAAVLFWCFLSVIIIIDAETWPKMIIALLGVTVFLYIAFTYATYFFFGILNGIIWGIGKLFIEPSQNADLMRRYQSVYVDYYSTLFLFCGALFCLLMLSAF